MWRMLMATVEDTENIEHSVELLKSLENAALYDMAYLVVKQLNHTKTGGQVQQRIITEILQEIWGVDMLKEFITRYITSLEKAIKKADE